MPKNAYQENNILKNLQYIEKFKEKKFVSAEGLYLNKLSGRIVGCPYGEEGAHHKGS